MHNKEEGVYPFLLPKTSNVADLADHLAKNVTLGGSGQIRIFAISKDGKRQEELNQSGMIGNLQDATELYAEVRFLRNYKLNAC
jgi:ubiquitin carboxyl-terminal hydrolase 7